MKSVKNIGRLAVSGFCATLAGVSAGLTTQTLGDGSAVTSIDRVATFDTLTYIHNGTALSDYSEDSLFVRTSGDSFSGFGPGQPPYFNPFHTALDPATQAFYYPDGGSQESVTIETTDSQPMFALEFLYGNGWTTGDIYGVPWGNDNAWVTWQTFKGANLVSSGQVGPDPLLPVGTVIGFVDPDGFDRLVMRCQIANQNDPTVQALALDDLHVQVTPVPEPASLMLLGLGSVLLLRRRKTV